MMRAHARHGARVLAIAVLVPALALGSCTDDPGRGKAASFCDTHDCIASFSEGTGSIVRCVDGKWSHSGGRPGACSHHGGVRETSAAPDKEWSEPSSTTRTDRRTPGLGDGTELASPSTEALNASAEQLVRNYYSDLDIRNFSAAWVRLTIEARATMGPYDTWRKGYENTLSNEPSNVDATLNGDGGATVTFTLRSTDLDECGEHVRGRFAATWNLTRTQNRWRVARANAMRVTGGHPANDPADCSSLPDDGQNRAGQEAPDVDPCITSCDSGGPRGNGYTVVCADGEISHSGGIQGACSHHGGVAGDDPSSSPGSSSPGYDSPSSPGTGSVHVDGYFRKDGTYVRPHTRRAPRP
jgi:hypothetical protein